ncbi:hypothetical protein HK100_010738, partial [Physocladia obscura]
MEEQSSEARLRRPASLSQITSAAPPNNSPRRSIRHRPTFYNPKTSSPLTKETVITTAPPKRMVPEDISALRLSTPPAVAKWRKPDSEPDSA